MENIIIKWGKTGWTEVEDQFTPQPGQKMFVQCPSCNTLHQVELGQGEVCPNGICTQCNNYLGEDCITSYIFNASYIALAYYDEQYLKPFTVSEFGDLNNNIKLCKSVSAALSETRFRELLSITEPDEVENYLNQSPHRRIIVIKDDIKALLYLYEQDIPLDKVYIIDNDYNVIKPNKINVLVDIQ